MSPSLSEFIKNITLKIQALRIEFHIKNEFLEELKAQTSNVEMLLNNIEENTDPQNRRLAQEIEANARCVVEQLFARCKSFAAERKAQPVTRDDEETWIKLQPSFETKPVIDKAEDNIYPNSPIFLAAKLNNVDTLLSICSKESLRQDLIKKDPQTLLFGNTPLLWAIANSSIDAALILLDRNIIPEAEIMTKQINLACHRGNTPLMLSCMKGSKHINTETKPAGRKQKEVAMRLLELGAEVNVANKDGYTALHFAFMHRDFQLVQALINKGADITQKNNNGYAPTDMLNQADETNRALLVQHATVITFTPPPKQQFLKALSESKLISKEIIFQVQFQTLLQTHLKPLQDKILELNNASHDSVSKMKAQSLQTLVTELSYLNKKDLQPEQVRAGIMNAFKKAENNPVLAIERHWLTKVAFALLNALTTISVFGLAYRGLFCDSCFFHHNSASQEIVEQTKQTFAKTLQ